jgi:hypothetical protein
MTAVLSHTAVSGSGVQQGSFIPYCDQDSNASAGEPLQTR